MSLRRPLIGWLGAASTAAALLTGASALALKLPPPPAPLMLDLGQLAPAAPAIAAIAIAAPQAVDEAPDLAPPAALADAPPPRPEAEARIARAFAPQPDLPDPDLIARSDLALPASDISTLPNAKPKGVEAPARPKPGPKPEPKPKPDPKPQERAAKPEPRAKPQAKASSATASAPQAGAMTKGGAKPQSSAAYAKAVMKKVRGTRKRSGAGKGLVVVGFTVAGSGGLAQVTVLQSSGNAALDEIALHHIQRSAPFPVPPAGVGRSFAFEFVGR